MYTYGQVERALCQLHGIPPEQASGKLRSRLKHFSRIGLTPSKPGRGQKLSYTPHDAVRWALCFEFAQLAVPPEVTKQILAVYGFPLFESFAGPTPKEDQVFWCLGNFFEDALTGGRSRKLGIVPMSEIINVVFKKAEAARVIMVNLTRIKRGLGKALDIDWEH
jgi:hypothetical protein